jgi:hypothetical protein
MTPQSDLNIICPLRPDRVGAVQAVLQEMASSPGQNPVVPFGELGGVHFGRVLSLDASQDLQGQPIPPQLLLMAELDGSRESFLQQLVDTSGPNLDRLFGHCAGYPDPSVAGNQDRLAFLRSHQLASSAYYINTVGRTVAQICLEARLRDAIEGFLDSRVDRSNEEPAAMRSSIQEFVRSDAELAPAGSPVIERDTGWWVRELLWVVGLPVVLLLLVVLLLPLVFLALIVYVVILRIHELSDPTSTDQPTPEHLASLAALEDRGPQNQFSAVGLLKPGPFRRFTAWLVLRITNLAAAHLFFHANLAGVKTIHFARWAPLDGGRRMIFASNYDGSLENYMDDFIDKVAFGLNATFSNGQGYPRSTFLLFRGAKDELTFKSYLQVRQVPTQVWYSAYPQLTALNIENNARIRAGLSGDMSTAEAKRWLALL